MSAKEFDFKPGQKIKVADNAPHHAGRVGEFDFLAGRNSDCVMLICERSKDYKVLFAIAPEHAIPLDT